MNRLGLSKLRCPRCQAILELQVVGARRTDLDGSARDALNRLGKDAQHLAHETIDSGALRCGPCDVWFPIVNGIPVMLVFRTGLHDDFLRRNGTVAGITSATAPRWDAEPGERNTQTTFTEEWLTTPTDELTFSHTEDDLRQLHQNVWLQWRNGPPSSVHTILDVGCGRGVEACVLRRIIPDAQAFGIDLNLSMVQRGYAYQGDPLLHLLVCSLFHPPFEGSSFDLVYSQGVIHHTYDTHAAFRSIARFVRRDGFLFVWVYGLEDDHVLGGTLGFIARAKTTVEKLARPILSRAPSPARGVAIHLASYAAYPFARMRVKNQKQWTLADTRHGLRDLLTPRYAHRHGFNEVIEWFEDLGFHCEVQSATAYRNIFGKRAFGVGVLGHRETASTA